MRHKGVRPESNSGIDRIAKTSTLKTLKSFDGLSFDRQLEQQVEECGEVSQVLELNLPTQHKEVAIGSKLNCYNDEARWEASAEVSNLSAHATQSGICSYEETETIRNRELMRFGNRILLLPHEQDSCRKVGTGNAGYYFPQLPNDVGLNCLSRICLTSIRKAALACRIWSTFLLGPELFRYRRSVNMREDWVFILGNSMENKWKVYRPISNDWFILPPCPNDYMFSSCDKESMVAGFNLLVLGQSLDGYRIWKFDIVRREWSIAPRMHYDRCLFGSATSGLFAYFAGGTNNGTTLRFAERFSSETGRWEKLPDMNKARKLCSGFMMDGKFFVVGGQTNGCILECGEAYDPKTGRWTLIQGLWPRAFVPSANVAPPLVAVLNEELYAIDITENRLMTYDRGLNQWQILEEIPDRAENVNGWGLGFKAVGNELFVIGGSRKFAQWMPYIHAYLPTSRHSGSWRFVVDIQAPTSGFIFNCAVMSG